MESKFEYFPDPPPSTGHEHEVKQETEPVFSLYNINSGSFEDLFNNTLISSLNLSSSAGSSAGPSASPSAGSHHDNNSQTNASDSDSSEDCEMIGETVPRPLDSTAEGLIKRDGDPISNDKPFITSVCCHWFYSISNQSYS